MRKVLSIFALALLMQGITACDSSNDIPKFTITVLNNAVNISQGTSEKVSNSAMSIEWDVNEATISLSYSVPLSGTTVANVNITKAKLSADGERNCYFFSAASAGSGITDLTGYYNPNIGTMHIEFMANGFYVSTNADLIFPYTTITTTNTEHPEAAPTENKEGVVLIKVSPSNMSAVLVMSGLALDGNAGDTEQIYFNNLQVTATGTGYQVTLPESQRSNNGTYVLNSFNASITANGMVINGNFVVNEKYNGTVQGTQFAK